LAKTNPIADEGIKIAITPTWTASFESEKSVESAIEIAIKFYPNKNIAKNSNPIFSVLLCTIATAAYKIREVRAENAP
jgi:hypothetical protein